MHFTPKGKKNMQFASLFNDIRLNAFILKTQFPMQQVRHVFLNKTIALIVVFLYWHLYSLTVKFGFLPFSYITFFLA